MLDKKLLVLENWQMCHENVYND